MQKRSYKCLLETCLSCRVLKPWDLGNQHSGKLQLQATGKSPCPHGSLTRLRSLKIGIFSFPYCVIEHDSRKSEFYDSGDYSTKPDASAVFSRPTSLEHISIFPRCYADPNRLYVSISKFCLDLSSIEFEDELLTYFLTISCLFKPIPENFGKMTFKGVLPGVVAPQAAELINKFAPKL